MDNRNYCFFRVDRRFTKIVFDDILYVETRDNYVKIETKARSYMILMSLRQMEGELPKHAFFRIHRSFLVSLQHITSFDEVQLQIGEICLPIGRVYRGKLETALPVSISDNRPFELAREIRMSVPENNKMVNDKIICNGA